jgi:putative chitinase
MRALDIDLLKVIASPKADVGNMLSVLAGLERMGTQAGLNQPHRLTSYLSQLAHESGGFRYDRELWGPTPAQERYDIRTDLGNTPEKDGDGYKYRGRTAMQLTGKANYTKFTQWCARQGLNPPDFVANPDLVNTDPWEGIVPIWYWDAGNPTGKSLNRYADEGDHEMVTRRINGGLNGYGDRLALYTKLGLAWLGFSDTQAGIRTFQTQAKEAGTYTRAIDGLDGPGTRAAIHQSLVLLGTMAFVDTKPAPVTEPIPVTPAGAQSTGVTRTVGVGGIVSVIGSFFADIPPGYKLMLVFAAVLAIVIMVWKQELIAARVKSAVKAFGLGNLD